MNKVKNWKSIWIFCFIAFVHNLSYAYEFLYPVAQVELHGETKVYVLYQKSVTHLELWIWDPETKIASKGLMSTYIPASIRILPSKDGFSFIDDGRIRIKMFQKRSPKAIDIYEPIYEMNQIYWIDLHNFYLSAKKNGKFCIFQMNDAGVTHCLVKDCIYDCVYPQKIGGKLFYIERHIKAGEYKKEHISYKLVSVDYPVIEDDEQDLTNLVYEEFELQVNKMLSEKKNVVIDDKDKDNEQLDEQKDHKKKEYIADFKSSPIAFLNMISETEGYFLEHSEEIDRQDTFILFSCYHMKKYDNKWSYKNIFDFSIPACLILDVLDFRLYESILPLIPRYYNGSLYYIDSSPIKTENLNLFRYNLKNETIEQKSFGKAGQIFLSPIFTKDKVFYGGCVNNACKSAPKMWINFQGFVCMDLPVFTC